MPKIAGDKLTKVTLNLYETDVVWIQAHYGQGYTENIRRWVSEKVQELKQKAGDADFWAGVR